MNGGPANLDLRFLLDATLVQVCIGPWDVQFHFHPAGSIFVQGGWELRDHRGVIVDRSSEVQAAEREPFLVHRLLGLRVASTEVSAPPWLALRFDGGQELRIFDDSDQFESFQIQPGSIIV
jgi:hypothetical protein